MTQAEESELDKLQNEYGALAKRKHEIRQIVLPLQDELNAINADIQRIGKKISILKHSNKNLPHVTDHAVVRYLERVEGVNIEEIRGKILGHDKAFREGNVIITVMGEKPEEQDI